MKLTDDVAAPATWPGVCRERLAPEIARHPAVDDVAAAVGQVCAAALNGRPGAALADAALDRWLARALCAAGLRAAAEDFLARAHPAWSSTRRDAELELLSRRADGPGLMELALAGVVRPYETLCHSVRPAWKLDLWRLHAAHAPELWRRMLLRQALRHCGALFCGGRSALFLHRPPPPRGERDDLPDYARAVLAQLARERGWPACPAVCETRLQG